MKALIFILILTYLNANAQELKLYSDNSANRQDASSSLLIQVKSFKLSDFTQKISTFSDAGKLLNIEHFKMKRITIFFSNEAVSDLVKFSSLNLRKKVSLYLGDRLIFNGYVFSIIHKSFALSFYCNKKKDMISYDILKNWLIKMKPVSATNATLVPANSINLPPAKR